MRYGSSRSTDARGHQENQQYNRHEMKRGTETGRLAIEVFISVEGESSWYASQVEALPLVDVVNNVAANGTYIKRNINVLVVSR